MATRTQITALLDTFNTTVKNDVNNTLPAGSNVIGGALNPATGTWLFILDAGNSAATAATLSSQITAALTTQGRTFSVNNFRRATDDVTRSIVIATNTGSYQIKNF